MLSSLLEASARRVAKHQLEQKSQERRERRLRERQQRKPPNATGYFVQYFFEAIATGNSKWASSDNVDILFVDDAKMATHDGGKYYGKTAVLKRLNRGIEKLLKMMGEHKAVPLEADQPIDIFRLPGVDIQGPQEVSPLLWNVVYSMKRGGVTYKFEDEFQLVENGQIKTLTRKWVK